MGFVLYSENAVKPTLLAHTRTPSKEGVREQIEIKRRTKTQSPTPNYMFWCLARGDPLCCKVVLSKQYEAVMVVPGSYKRRGDGSEIMKKRQNTE